MARQVQTTFTVYPYAELPAKVKEKIRDQYRANQREVTSDLVLRDRFTEVLDEKGYPTDKIEWSLSSCQGDGVAFYGRVSEEGLVKIAKRIAETMTRTDDDSLVDWPEHVILDIERNHFGRRYSHSRTMDVKIEHGETFSRDTEARLLDAIETDVRATSKQLEALGYSLLYYPEIDEETDQDITALGCEYTIDGKEYVE